ncbi:hypothetical protein TIFTF001_029457 [Ficus carica]|uniref:Uncharacterized protein n=1 Tax=Ficus carica TaxID=3494 RepID=A0AA88DRW8_FICCA|nr:hypothetical protein TIFTF001_029457 [Ficus carica]
MTNITEVNNTTTTATITEINAAPTDLTKGQPQEAINRRIAELMAENKELRRRFIASIVFKTPLPSIVTTFGSSTQPGTAAANFFPSGFYPTMTFMPYSPLHSIPALYSQPQPLYGAPPTEAFNLSKPSSMRPITLRSSNHRHYHAGKISRTKLFQVRQDNRSPQTYLLVSTSHAWNLYAEGIKRRHNVQALPTKPQGQRHQVPEKSLRSFVKQFSKAVAEILNCNDIVALLTFKRGLTPNLSFLNEICSRKPRTIVEALARAQGLIECEGFNKTPHVKGHSLEQRSSQLTSRQKDNN